MSRVLYERLVKDTGFSAAQKQILELVKECVGINKNSITILEVGSSSGYLTKVMVEMGAVVDIVEVEKAAFEKAKKISKAAIMGSIEDGKVQAKILKKYDLIICADVLEHLVDPEAVLEFLKKHLKKTGVFLISIPNVAFWEMRKQLLLKGDFSYQDSGLMDRTHLRFYSLNNFLDLLKGLNIQIDNIFPAEARIPFEYSLKRIPLLGGLFLRTFKSRIVKKFPNLTIYHYVIKTKAQY